MEGKRLPSNRCEPAYAPAGVGTFVGVHGAKLIGVTADAYLHSSELLVRGLDRACELYRPDGLPIVFDLQLEAEVWVARCIGPR
jgi:hypothetical protein